MTRFLTRPVRDLARRPATAPARAAGPLVRVFTAMATTVRIELHEPGPGAFRAAALAEDVFRRVESACTRFDQASPLMRANAAGTQWCPVPAECFEAVAEAAAAHQVTGGLFDPRVLSALQELGYDRALPFGRADGVQVVLDRVPAQHEGPGRLPPAPGSERRSPARSPARPAARPEWSPGLDEQRVAVRVGPDPIDLGGIGKGLAVRWAAAAMVCAHAVFAPGAAGSFKLDAGGDCLLGGPGPDGGWRVGVQDPHVPIEGGDPVAVLALSGLACATSSVRRRSWTACAPGHEAQMQAQMHHLIDPRTGTSAAPDPVAVTVVAADPALAEVWSKSLLIAGADRIAELAAERGLAALWVRADGTVAVSPAMRAYAVWQRPIGMIR